MSYRVFIANATIFQIAEIGQSLGLSGSVTGSTLGFGAWGIEPAVFVELGDASAGDIERFVEAVFEVVAEEAVYVMVDDGVGETWYRDGRVT